MRRRLLFGLPVAGLLSLLGWGGSRLASPAPVKATPAPVEAPTVVAAPEVVEAPVVAPSVTTTPEAPSWEGIAVTVVCPMPTSDASLRAACPDYFGTGWREAATRDGYSTGSQKLALADCGADHIDELDAETAGSLTCRDSLNAAIYGQDGSGGGACAAEIAAYCRGLTPTPGSNPTDKCLEGVVVNGDPASMLSAACAGAVANHAWNEAAQKAR